MDKSLIPEILKLLGAVGLLAWGLWSIYRAKREHRDFITGKVIISWVFGIGLLAWTHFSNRLW